MFSVPNFLTLQTLAHTDQVQPGDTSERPFARTHCILERPGDGCALLLHPAGSTHPGPPGSSTAGNPSAPSGSPAPARSALTFQGPPPQSAFPGPLATVLSWTLLRSPRGPTCARRRGPPPPQCTPRAPTFSGNPRARESRAGSGCRRPSRPGQAQGPASGQATLPVLPPDAAGDASGVARLSWLSTAPRAGHLSRGERHSLPPLGSLSPSPRSPRPCGRPPLTASSGCLPRGSWESSACVARGTVAFRGWP